MDICDNTNVQVVIRLRPPTDQSEDITEQWSFPPDKPQQLSIADPLSRGRSEHVFAFSKILKPDTSQEKAFESVSQPLVDHVLNGFNSCTV